MGEFDSTMTNPQTICLRNLIGRQVLYHGVRYEIIEVLEEGPSLVLEDCEDHKTIQADQHGEAHRRVPQTVTLIVPFTQDGDADLPAIGLDILDKSATKVDSLQC